MAVSLSKGANVSLSKEEPGLVRILVGLGWNPRPTDGDKFDLDASIFMLGENGKCPTDQHFIFYGNKTSPDAAKSVVHQGDNQTGEGEGDDEKIVIDLSKVPADIHKLVIGVTIHKFLERRQNFGMVDNSYVRIVNDETGREIAKYDLNEESALETAMLFGEVYRYGGEWKFKAIGQGFAGGLAKMAGNYGIDAG